MKYLVQLTEKEIHQKVLNILQNFGVNIERCSSDLYCVEMDNDLADVIGYVAKIEPDDNGYLLAKSWKGAKQNESTALPRV